MSNNKTFAVIIEYLEEVIDKRNNSNEFINIYEFPKKVYAKLYLSLDKIWKIDLKTEFKSLI